MEDTVTLTANGRSATVSGAALDRAAQTEIFPDAARLKKAEEELAILYKRAARTVEGIPEFGEFFKLFGKYVECLDQTESKKAEDLLLLNVDFALESKDKLGAKLQEVRKLLLEAKELEAEIDTLDLAINGTTRKGRQVAEEIKRF